MEILNYGQINYDTHPQLRGNAEKFMREISPRDLGLEEEAKGIRGIVQKIKETVKRIFAVQRFTVIYRYQADRRCARSCINEVVGWTPFKKIEYLDHNDVDDYLANNSFSGKRVLFVDTMGGIGSSAERIMKGSHANQIRRIAIDDPSINFCHYYDYDIYEDLTNQFYNWIGNGHHFQPKNVNNLKYKNNARREFNEYYRLVGKKFLQLN
jgi:hypothetical protein